MTCKSLRYNAYSDTFFCKDRKKDVTEDYCNECMKRLWAMANPKAEYDIKITFPKKESE